MVRLERIRYKPIPVRELLVEMKDLSEIMIDLAYSASLFDSKPLAEEVIQLERRVDTLAYLLDMNAMVAVRSAEDAESLVGVSVLAAAADKISDAAADLAKMVLYGPTGIHPVVLEAFKKMEKRLTRVVANSNSVLVGKSLGELNLSSMGVDVIAVRRDKDLTINPKEDEIIRKGDIITARGAPGGVEEFEKLAEGILQTRES